MLAQMQFLRFAVFMGIFMLHLSIWPVFDLPVRNSAAAAVSFFFILSGFLSGYKHCREDAVISVKSICFYVVKKLKRFYPLYFFLTLFTVSYSGIAKDIAFSDWAGLKSSLLQFLKCLFLVQSWFGEGWFRFAGTGWFLSSMLFLYLFCLPMAAFVGWVLRKKYGIWTASVLFAGIIAAEVLYCYVMRNANMEFWEYIFPPARLGEYLGGIVLGGVVQKLSEKISFREKKMFTFLEMGALFLWGYCLYLPVPEWQYRVVFWLVPNFTIITVFAFGRGLFSELFKTPLLRYLGDISFEGFLLHPVVIHIYLYVSEVGNVSRGGNIFSVLFCFFMTMYISGLCHQRLCRRATYM